MNEVKTIFVGDAADLFRVADKVEERVRGVTNTTKNIGQSVSFGNLSQPIQKLGNDFLTLEKRALSLQTQLRRQSSNAADLGFNALSNSAATAADRASQLQTQLRRISLEATRTSNQTILSQLNNEAREVQRELREIDRSLAGIRQINVRAQSNAGGFGNSSAEQRFGRINLARQGADVFTQAGSGASAGIIAIQQGPQIIEALAQAGVKASSVLQAVSSATLGIAGGLAVAGAIVVKVSSDLRTEAERRLKIEEKAAAVYGMQGQKMREQLDLAKQFNEQRTLSANQRNFGANVEAFGNDPAKLKALREETEKSLDFQRRYLSFEFAQAFNPKDPEQAKQKAVEKRYQPIISSLENRLQELDPAIEKATKNLTGFTPEDIARNKKASEESLELERRRLADVDKGIEKAKELTKIYRGVFEDLTIAVNAENPFVKFAVEGDKAFRLLREQTRGLSDDLRQQAEVMLKQQNDLALFRLRVSTVFSAFDLREQAQAFRSTPQADQLVQKRQFDQIVAANVNRGNRFQFGGTIGSFLANQAGGIGNLTDEQKRQVFETSLFQASSSGLNQASLVSSLARSRNANPLENLSAQERLDRQFGLLGNFQARNPQEQGEIDSRITSIAGRLNPEEIRADQREKIAAAFERQAERTERRQQEALDVAKKQLTVNERILDNQERLLKVAERQGVRGVEVLVRDETGGSVRIDGSRPTQDDVRETYDFGGFGLGGGSNR